MFLVSFVWKPNKMLVFLQAQFSNEGNTVLPSCAWQTYYNVCRHYVLWYIVTFHFLYLLPSLMTDDSTPSVDSSQSPSQCRATSWWWIKLSDSNKTFTWQPVGQRRLHHLTRSLTPSRLYPAVRWTGGVFPSK